MIRYPQLRHFCISAVSRRFSQIARIQWLSVALVAVLGFAGSATVGFIGGIPEPEVHDEFAHLLAADTFAHGRLTNPTHPMWIHFETIQVIHQPSYMSKFPPGQGVILAVGQVLSGKPILGVWISFGLMCAAVCWMLYAWVRPSWAFLGGFLVMLHPSLGLNGYWAQSYWGGAVAATGGALVIGGLRRIVRRAQMRDALLLAIGLALLANSRPYEGLLFSLPTAVVLLVWICTRQRADFRIAITRIVLPLFVIVTLTGIAMVFYNLSGTGSLFLTPYQVHEATYGEPPKFPWQALYPQPTYNHKVMANNVATELTVFNQRRLVMDFLLWKKGALRSYWDFYLGIVFSIPLLIMAPILLALVLRNRWMLFALLTCIVLIAAVTVESWAIYHYAAPITGLVFVFVLQAMRLWRWRDRRTARWVVNLIILFCLYMLGRSVYADMKQGRSPDWRQDRARLVRQLEKQPGKHLVIVRYGPAHSVAHEYVYNRADIDGAKVVWARDMVEPQNRELVEYFKDRQLWYLDEGWDSPSSVNLYRAQTR